MLLFGDVREFGMAFTSHTLSLSFYCTISSAEAELLLLYQSLRLRVIPNSAFNLEQ